MANGDDTDVGAPPGGSPLASAPPSPARQPPGGGPVIAALAQRANAPQVSAPGPGNTADAMSMLKMAVDIIQRALLLIPSGTPMHAAVLNALRQLTRHMAQGTPTVGAQQTQLMDLLRGTMRNAMMPQMMASAGGGSPPAQNPSLPLPGA